MVKKAVDGSFSDSSNSFIRQVGLAKKLPVQYSMTMVELSSRQPTSSYCLKIGFALHFQTTP